MQKTKTKPVTDAAASEPGATEKDTEAGISASWVLLAIGSARESRGLDSPLPGRRLKSEKPD